jgi:glycosyltransferase involved in cell wall biosynthesis
VLGWQGVKLATRLPGVIGTWRGQVTWLERELLPGHLSLERLLKTPCVFDVDDAIWLVSPKAGKAAERIGRRADVVVAGNSFIADWFEPTATEVRVVPTAVDTRRFHPETRGRAASPFIVGWTGVSANFGFLYAIEKELAGFLEAAPDSLFLVVADQPPRFKGIPPERIRFVLWRPEIEAEVVRGMDVGLMPLSMDDWSRGKCSFKMLQYMACGMPVVVTEVGMNAEILSMAQVGVGLRDSSGWREALLALHADDGLRKRLGTAGRELVERRFSLDVVTPQLAGVFKDVSA